MIRHGFERQSPRHTPRPIRLASRLIGAIAPVLFVLLLAQSLFSRGLGMWAVGVVYILYDTALLIFTAKEIRGLVRAEPTFPPGAPRPAMTVIIAAHNEAPVLGITIDTLMAQADPPEFVLLADDGSDDDSARILADLYGLTQPAIGALSDPSPILPALRWFRLPQGGKARALNAAMAVVETELVCTLDADTLLAPGALQAMRQAFADPHLVSATGVLVPICGPRPTQRLFEWFQRYEYVRNFLSRYAWAQVHSLLLISGAFAGFRTRAVLDAGGFDPDCMVEDYELIHRMLRYSADEGLGWTTRVIGRAVATTDAPASAIGFLRQRRRWFGGFLQTQHWYRDMVGNRDYGTLGTAHLPIKSLDRWQPLYGLAAFVILIAAAVAGRLPVVLPVIGIMLAKVVVDLAFHLWSITIYRRWTGQHDGLALAPALLASIVEPFTFQLLRHVGAAWGWIAFLRGRETWVKQQRTAITASADR